MHHCNQVVLFLINFVQVAAVLAANWSQYGKSCGSNNEIPTECAEQTQSSPLANSHSLLPAVEVGAQCLALKSTLTFDSGHCQW